MSDDPIVPVKAWLRPWTFRQLTAHAVTRGITVGELLSRLADASLQPVEKRARIIAPKTSQPSRRRTKPLTVAQQEFAADLSDPRHGTLTGYQTHRCRCERCVTARREYDVAREERLRAERERA